jgi:mannonate dehydratase
MALHPADPWTVDRLEGIPRLFRDFESFKHAMTAVPGETHGLKLCLGCFSEMRDADLFEVIEYFGERDEIVFVHFRDVVGTMTRFHETFLNEGNYDEYDAVRKLCMLLPRWKP